MPFADPLHDQFASWILGFAPYGGGDVGEVEALAPTVPAGDDDAFFTAFHDLAVRRIEEGDAAAAKGHRATAHDCYLRACAFLGVAYHPLYGTPVDPRLLEASHLQSDVFGKALAALDHPGEALAIPYDTTTIPAWFVRAPGHEQDVRPTIIVGGGWDSTMPDNHLGLGVAALRRGYHVLLFDGPGQGRLLFDEGLPLRHDWEHVVGPVIDAALANDAVDPERLVYEPWSLGGYFAPRVAAHDDRLAAIVADPGQIDVGGKITGALGLFGVADDAIARLPALDPDDVQKVMTIVEGDRGLHWRFVRRGFWTNGADDLVGWITEMIRWKLTPDEVAGIRCPTLVTKAQSDVASSNAQELYDALTCPKALFEFADADGAGMHCEMLNRSLANRRILDWLDEVLAPACTVRRYGRVATGTNVRGDNVHKLPKVMSWVSVVVGALAIVVGLAVYITVHVELADQKITVSDDAPFLGGDDVDGPFSALAQAFAINDHAKEAGGGKTYAELGQDDPKRQTVMTADFLQASLYTSVVAFGVAVLIMALGVVMIFIGLTFRELDRRTLERAGPSPAVT